MKNNDKVDYVVGVIVSILMMAIVGLSFYGMLLLGRQNLEQGTKAVRPNVVLKDNGV